MEFFRKLSVKFKILLIPAVGSIGFIIYLSISMYTSSVAVDLLGNAQNVRFPLLQVSERSLVLLDKIKKTLSDAVTEGEIELLEDANTMATQIQANFKKAAGVDKETATELRELEKQFDSYYKLAFEISKEMVDGTADFSTISSRSKAMSEQLLNLQNNLNSFQKKQMSSFTDSFTQVNEKAEATNNIGIVMAIITIALLFTVSDREK